MKFDDSQLIEDDGSKTCIDGGDADGIRDTHLSEEISTQLYHNGLRIFLGGTLCVHLLSSSMMIFNILGIS